MGIHLQPKVLILRSGSALTKYGDPYEFAATVTITGHEAIIEGAVGQFSWQSFYDLKIQLRNMGVTRIIWERIKKNMVKKVNVELK